MDKNALEWKSIHDTTRGRQPRETLISALARLGSAETTANRTAIDLGCGDGTETAHLLAQGWHVIAIDSEPSSIEHLRAAIPAEAQNRLQTQVVGFEEVELAPANLIYAGYSLPYCPPEHFDSLWRKIVGSLDTGDRFAGQFFGVNDTWAGSPGMVFMTKDKVLALFSAFEIEDFQEEDEDGLSSNVPKHWHVFHVIARKK